MTAQEMWKLYSSGKNIRSDFDAWAFEDDADKLADLVLSGTKTATASLEVWYTIEQEPLPAPGKFSVVLDSQRQAVCVIRTTRVHVVPFLEVDDRHAWKEGEGDRSLVYWRTVHERFFRKELAQAGQSFYNGMNVVCEEFVRVYP